MMELPTILLLSLLVPFLSISVHADEARFFPDKGMDFGVFYYPEHWPEESWERDIKNTHDIHHSQPAE